MFHELSDETQRLLDGHTAHKVNNESVVAIGNLLHCFNLIQKIGSL